MKIHLLTFGYITLNLIWTNSFAHIEEYTLSAFNNSTTTSSKENTFIIINTTNFSTKNKNNNDDNLPDFHEDRRLKNRRKNISRLSIKHNLLLENNDRRIVDMFLY